NPKSFAKASIIESSVQKGRGAVATIIVQNGTLTVGSTVVAGEAYGKVRAMSDDQGKALKEIKPGECGVIVGLSEVADAGEILIAVKSDKEAREYANKRHEYNRQKELSKSTKVSIDELGAKIKEGNLKALPVILKADVQGSLEALKASLEKLRNDEIKVNIIHSGVGGITQSDIELASASENSIVLGFNIRPTGEVKERAKDKGVEIKTYNVIYNLLDDVKALLGGMMSPIISEEQLGQAEIRQVINVPKIGQIAGCMVTEGVINRGAKIRLIRDGVVVYEGNVSSLKRFKDDAKEVAKGYECGVGIEGCDDMRVGDYIESYKEVEEQASL
ncbi:TPA: translation initiation factor IF-2, partial [Campylobacter coli]|nr:translation initiation factor IF-2 [Campylobacter coli]